MIAAPDDISCQVRHLMYLRCMPLWRARDTPHRAFYRLYEAFCAADGHTIAYETEYFWRRSSPSRATASIPDPECEDPEQYAVLASLAEVLVRSLTWRLELGLRRNDTPFVNIYKNRSSTDSRRGLPVVDGQGACIRGETALIALFTGAILAARRGAH
ncbi:Uncharacterized protein TCAP_04542 [Tolypocladium capitatum]|uniref:Uncharacterized protein n=1 Tax=Tolypocladium capitatum TaxID=45235 RepID=A0A2K3QD93_9HYPO|nr:Uncharacterized protein TCAP_04542 [Tolypocladium capitatum]